MIGHVELRWSRMVLAVVLACGASPAASAPAAESAAADGAARGILETAGVQGGLVVHLGCGDGKLTGALRAGAPFLVHGLDADAANVEKARAHVRERGLCGDVSVEQLTGKQLPYVDGLVNLVVVEDPGDVPMDEVMRVLAPGGAVCVRQGDGWKKTLKPRSPDTDEWTHMLYDTTNNAVSSDEVVGPPHQVQWVGGPRWLRSHDHLASLSAAVSSGGRIFYIVDEAPIAAVVLKPQWNLVARDGASGVVLWKRSIDQWQWHLRGFRSGPADIGRRLVAWGDRVYVTLGLEAPVSALDAATGKTLATYAGTEGTREILCEGDKLYLVAGEPGADRDALRCEESGERPGLAFVFPQRPAYPEKPPKKRLMVLDAGNGGVLWKKDDAETAELMPTTLAVSNGKLFFQNPDEILCLEAATGKEVWRAARPVARNRPSWTAPTLVVHNDVILSADRAAPKEPAGGDEGRKVHWTVSNAGGQAPVGELIAFSAADGERLWSCPAKECYNSPTDVLVAGGLVWTGQLVRANEPGFTEGRDPKTGEVKRTRPADQQFFQPGMGHGRCHRNRATQQYLILGRSGVEFIDVATGRGIANHWTRGTCQFGVIFADGLLYAPPHPCACFIRSKLAGFNCFAPKRQSAVLPEKLDPAARLVRGPAYPGEGGQESGGRSQEAGGSSSGEWPTYRHDAARSGRASTTVSGELTPAWQAELGGKLSPVVIAGGKLFVTQIDAQTVHALDAATGEPLWSFTAGGRVDTPPTIVNVTVGRSGTPSHNTVGRSGTPSTKQQEADAETTAQDKKDGVPLRPTARCIFGSRDGWVYCLRAGDGELAWRFRAAPAEQRIVACGRIESCWPVHGSVLVRDGVVYCAAGRGSYLEGGVRLCRLDAATGRLLSETTIDHRDPETGHQPKGVVNGTNMPGAKPDVLSSQGGSVFMRHNRFDLEGRLQEPDEPHLFAPAGFLDGEWWHRTYWLVGTVIGTNYGGWPHAGNQAPAGRLLVVDDGVVYGFGRNHYIHHGAHVGIDGATVFHFRPPRDNDHRLTFYRAFAAETKPAGGRKPARQYRWTQKLPVLARAMVKAGDALYLAGPPDLFATGDPHAALAGEQGGRLVVLAPADGTQQTDLELPSPPVFDGLAAAGGRLYMATMDGKVVCLGGVK